MKNFAFERIKLSLPCMMRRTARIAACTCSVDESSTAAENCNFCADALLMELVHISDNASAVNAHWKCNLNQKVRRGKCCSTRAAACESETPIPPSGCVDHPRGTRGATRCEPSCAKIGIRRENAENPRRRHSFSRKVALVTHK